jgi:hypothetical protein
LLCMALSRVIKSKVLLQRDTNSYATHLTMRKRRFQSCVWCWVVFMVEHHACQTCKGVASGGWTYLTSVPQPTLLCT